jgi:hypothetical protein
MNISREPGKVEVAISELVSATTVEAVIIAYNIPRNKQHECTRNERRGGCCRDEQDGSGLNPANRSLLTLIKQVAFIKQEAMEKAREIEVKAKEEFAMEKVRPWTTWPLRSC